MKIEKNSHFHALITTQENSKYQDIFKYSLIGWCSTRNLKDIYKKPD